MDQQKPFILIIPPEGQRIWLINPLFLWAYYQPTIIFLEESDYNYSEMQSQNSPYDFSIFKAMENLRRRSILWSYNLSTELSSATTMETERKAYEIVKKHFSSNRNSLISIATHVWKEYKEYLKVKDSQFPPLKDEFYKEVYKKFESDKKETEQHLETFMAGKLPTTTDVDFILSRIVLRVLLSLELTINFRKKRFPGMNVFAYATWEYKPVIDIVCRDYNLDSMNWFLIEGKDLSEPWKCLEEAFVKQGSTKYQNGIFHFVKKASEAMVLIQSAKEVAEIWQEQGYDPKKTVEKIRHGLQYALNIVNSSKIQKFFNVFRDTYEYSQIVKKNPPMPFNLISNTLSKYELWRIKNKISAFAYLYLLKLDTPLLKLPILKPPFGPKERENDDSILKSLDERRWQKWQPKKKDSKNKLNTK